MNGKNIRAANPNLSCFKEIKQSKWKMTQLQIVLINTIICVGVDTDIVIIIVIVLGVNGL